MHSGWRIASISEVVGALEAGAPMKPAASIKEEAAVLSDQALRIAAALRG